MAKTPHPNTKALFKALLRGISGCTGVFVSAIKDLAKAPNKTNQDKAKILVKPMHSVVSTISELVEASPELQGRHLAKVNHEGA